MNARFCLNCGASLTQAEQTPYQPPATHQAPPMAQEFLYAGFWKRVFAFIIDGIIINSIMFVIAIWGFGSSANVNNLEGFTRTWILYSFSYIFVQWMYFALLESSSKQATIGKQALGIKVTDMAGQPLSFMRAAGRQAAGAITSVTLLIGYLMAAFTRRKQTLHDMIAGAVVVNKNFGPNQIVLVNQNPPSGMSVGGIIGVIGIVLIIPVGGIIAAIAIPAYNDYTIRAQVESARQHAAESQNAIANYAIDTGYWPENFEQANLSTDAMQTDDYFIRLVEDGVLQVTFKKPQVISGDTLRLIPELKNSGDYEWRCDGGRMAQNYLPSDCRH